jgi:hypothetical protein
MEYEISAGCLSTMDEDVACNVLTEMDASVAAGVVSLMDAWQCSGAVGGRVYRITPLPHHESSQTRILATSDRWFKMWCVASPLVPGIMMNLSG